MCDYQTLIPTTDGSPVKTRYCQRAAQFWVQSLMSTHNMLACTHHLARIIRHVEAEAAKYDIMRSQDTAAEYPDGGDSRYTKPDGRRLRMTKEDSNYARVTVKPYTRKGN
jgi:hypothetical protein